MAGIAGIGAENRNADVERALQQIDHRGRGQRGVFTAPGATLGAVWGAAQPDSLLLTGHAVQDRTGGGRLASARMEEGELVLTRDHVGLAPLYYGRLADGCVCFASEFKAICQLTGDVHELPPGHRWEAGAVQPSGPAVPPAEDVPETPEEIARELRRRLQDAVRRCLSTSNVGSWLSGGLDSSTMAALARPQTSVFHTFAAGLAGAPDLEFAREVAAHIGSRHHEVLVTLADMLRALPEVIYHLESFDALLVRSSITNYLVAQCASEWVAEVFSGEGGDELFAGYEYLRSIPSAKLAAELLDITGRLHNTALQRVDRCASAHGLVPHVCFLDPGVMTLALAIPARWKLHDDVEKWILRQAVADLLPDRVLWRRKAKFWEGAGVGELLSEEAEQKISDQDFARQRLLPNGWQLNTKEELMYYRAFREHYADAGDLSWMGRTKGAPVH
ncbi:MAG TPA: asparagine synthase-related protein [Candidatus Anammoximicrobium sp.]|nr:asparagine synthase-related protein [Candidatus Anammoximicrobium sp.]